MEKFLNTFNIKLNSYQKELLEKIERMRKEGKQIILLHHGRPSGRSHLIQALREMREVKED